MHQMVRYEFGKQQNLVHRVRRAGGKAKNVTVPVTQSSRCIRLILDHFTVSCFKQRMPLGLYGNKIQRILLETLRHVK